MSGELPKRENKRGGAGWWMDVQGMWRPPSEWPFDHPPLDGWTRNQDGRWQAPQPVTEATQPAFDVPREVGVDARIRMAAKVHTPPSIVSHEVDRRGVLVVTGALGAAAFLLAVALVLITRASADDVVTTEVRSDVLFAADTDSVRAVRRLEAAKLAPEAAKAQLSELPARVLDEPAKAYASSDWVATSEGCPDTAEQVLIGRSTRAVTWADELKCSPDRGQWVDRNLEVEIDRARDASVVAHVPPEIVHVSGGSEWAAATRQAYVTDTRHPATLQVIARSSGHNPRAQDPSEWRPSNRPVWCAYAVDWIAVKHRWGLSVTDAERGALAEMLETCTEPQSAGADPMSMPIDGLPAIAIERDTTE